MQKLHGEIYDAKLSAFAVRCRNTTGFHGRNSKRDDSFYHHADNPFLTCGATCWLTCGVTSGLGLVNAQPAVVNKILPKLRPAIPAQKPNQPRLWLDCACQRWSRKPNHRRAAPDTFFRTTLTGAGEPYNGRGERAGNRKRVQFLRLNSGSLAQLLLGLGFSSFDSAVVMRWR